MLLQVLNKVQTAQPQLTLTQLRALQVANLARTQDPKRIGNFLSCDPTQYQALESNFQLLKTSAENQSDSQPPRFFLSCESHICKSFTNNFRFEL